MYRQSEKMKKQFYRVKQLADQRVGRAEKTEILSEDLQNVEKTVEKIKHACQSTNKRLTACMQGSGGDFEKRLAFLFQRAKAGDDISGVWHEMKTNLRRKLHSTALAQSMIEASQQLGDDSLLGTVLASTGDAESALAVEQANYEIKVEKNVIAPLTSLLENDIPSIGQQKKKLLKARLDMDTCRSRWSAAVKASHGASKDMMAAAAKADALKDQHEEEQAKFENCQDALTTEMLTFVSREGEYADWIIKFLEAQYEFHKNAAVIFENMLPTLKKQVDSSIFRPNYGCPLEDHLRVHEREIAFVIEECVTFLQEYAMDVQGLFRLAGSAAKVRKLKASFDAGLVDLAELESDVHVVTGALKQYLRELPEPLMTFKYYDEWIQAASIQDNAARLLAYWKIVNKLPRTNLANLKYLICFLGKLASRSEVTKMSASNIAIVIAPNIIWSEQEKDDGGVNVQHTGLQSSIVEALIQHYKWFFPDPIDFTRKSDCEQNGPSNSTSPAPTDSLPRSSGSSASSGKTRRKSSDRFKQTPVTEGLLEEVMTGINLQGTKEETVNGSSPEDGRRAAANPKTVNRYEDRVLLVDLSEETRKPVAAQVKFLGSTSPTSTSPPPTKGPAPSISQKSMSPPPLAPRPRK